MTVDPTAETIRPFIEDQSEDGPFVMLNLLAFKPDGGRERYVEYGIKTQPHLERVGGEVMYFGEGGDTLVQTGRKWDAVMLVKYPNRAAFLDMVANAEYQEISKIRTAALEDAVLQPTHPFSA